MMDGPVVDPGIELKMNVTSFSNANDVIIISTLVTFRSRKDGGDKIRGTLQITIQKGYIHQALFSVQQQLV